MMAFCNIHCLRKSSRIIVIPTTSVNVLWDAIVPLSVQYIYLYSHTAKYNGTEKNNNIIIALHPPWSDRPFAKHRNSLSFGTHRWCFLTSTINDT